MKKEKVNLKNDEAIHQLKLDFDQHKDQKSEVKVIFLNPRKEIYERILSRR